MKVKVKDRLGLGEGRGGKVRLRGREERGGKVRLRGREERGEG